MEKYNSEKELLKTIAQRKYYLFIATILVIISGFLLFNQISYIGTAYKENTNASNQNVIILYN
jgi:multidrug resistance efflux pump